MGAADFFQRMMPHAQRVSDATGIDPRLVLAQAALETGYGKHAPDNNFFGIKSHGRSGGNNLQTQEFENGRMVTKSQNFRGYSDPGQSFDDYGNFLQRNPRYKPVLQAGTLAEQIEAMGRSGYATDPNYASKLSKIAGMVDGNFQPSSKAIADDAMRAIGKDPIRQTSTAIGGQGADTMQQSTGLLGQLARPEDKVGGLLGMMFKNMTPDRADQIRAGLAGLQGIENQGVYNAATQRMGDRKADRRLEDKHNREMAEKQQAQTQAESFFSNRPDGEMWMGALRAGANPKDILSTYVRTAQASNDPSVQSSQMLQDMSGTVFNMKSGDIRVVTVGGETLTGQAALDFVQKSNQNYTTQQRSIYGARREGALGAEIELGGPAAAAAEAGKQSIDMAGEAWAAYGQLQSSIGTMDEAISALDAGGQSGAFQKFLPNITEASARLNNAMDRMGLDVISATTFGALSEGELRLAMETAVPRNLDEPELRAWLERRRSAQAKASAMLSDAAQYLSNPRNNLNGWIAKNRNVPQQTPPAPQSSGATGAPKVLRFNADGTLTDGR